MGKVLAIGVVAIVAIVGYMFWSGNEPKAVDLNTQKMAPKTGSSEAMTGAIKEFTTTAFYDDKGVWYSLKEIRVKKGDTVRVKATNTKGMHDFSLDEFGVKAELPLNQEVVIDFKADKAGEFTYYCSKPGHKSKGQFGKLIVE